MAQVIIYNQDSGVLAICRPTEEALSAFGIDKIAQKDVPEGRAFRIIDDADLPEDRSTRGRWTLAQSGEIELLPALLAIPSVVSRFQARAALLLAGLLDDVEALMSAPGTPALAKLAWADAQEFKRNSPTVQAMAAAIGLTEAQLDELFTTAAGIDA